MKTDIERMNEFDGEVLSYLLKRTDVQNPEPNPGFFKDDKNILLFSRTNGILSGFLWAHSLVSPYTLKPKMLLYSIDVFPEFRRTGIATMLIRELKGIARSLKCRAMFVPTGKNNVAAIVLYRSTGGRSENDDDITFTYDRDALST
jgi:ribosomal protein S18 acetylase RimI-like enzyme